MQYLANLTSKGLLQGLLHYYLPRSNKRMQLPKDRLKYWFPDEFTFRYSSANDFQNLEEALKLNRDLLMRLRADADSMTYYAGAIHAVLSKLHHGLSNGIFNRPDFVNALALKICDHHLELMNTYHQGQEPPLPWKLALDAHLTHSFYIDQYLMSSLAVHLIHDLPTLVVKITESSLPSSNKKDMELLYSFYQAALPKYSNGKINWSSGLTLSADHQNFNALNKTLKNLNLRELMRSIKALDQANPTEQKAHRKELETKALALSQELLDFSGALSSVLKLNQQPNLNSKRAMFNSLENALSN
ncbi:MAG: DUF5995 family protein [Owenweeksia sp.]|nr:DUF5995 family protein [Owenweeksia sp.]